MAFSFAHYCPHCRVPCEVYVKEAALPEGTNSFRYQCPKCQGAVSYSPYRLMRALSIPGDGVVAVLCQAQPTRTKAAETLICESSSDTVLLPKITEKRKLPSPPLPPSSPATEQVKKEGVADSTPQPMTDRKSPLSSLGVRRVFQADQSTETPDDPANSESLQEVAALRGHRGWVKTVAFTADREMIVSGGQEGSIRLWRFDHGGPPEQTIPHLHSGGVQGLALGPAGKILAAAAANPEGIVRLWDISSTKAKLRALLQVPKAPVEALAFSPNGKLLAVSSSNVILLWNLNRLGLREDCVLRGHVDIIKALAFSPDGSTLASASQDGAVRLWTADLSGARELAVLEGSKTAVASLAFSPDGQTLALGGADHGVILWEANGNKPKKRAVLQGHRGAVRLLIFPSDGQTILSVDDKNCVFLWNLPDLTKSRQWMLPDGTTVASVAGTSDGRYLATGTMGAVTMFRLYPKAKNPSTDCMK
jgi:WD40 repeat protein